MESYYQRNKDKLNLKKRLLRANNPQENLNHKLWYGKRKITVEDYNLLIKKQNNLCAICNKPETIKYKSGSIRSLAIDHCHETGKIRGLLCMKCNRGLGFFNDNIDLMYMAVGYLKKYI